MSDGLQEQPGKVMDTAELVRLEMSDEGTLGVLRVNFMIVCVTLELPWRENQQNVSCIPTGTYIVRPYISSRFGEVFEVGKVPGRYGILIHPGNTAKDSTGCILVGSRVGYLEGKRAVLDSCSTMKKLKGLLGENSSFPLRIKEAF